MWLQNLKILKQMINSQVMMAKQKKFINIFQMH